MAIARFSDLTTLRVGGPIGELVIAANRQDLIEALQDERAMVVGGGSNLLVSDDGYDGRVVRIATTGIEMRRDDEQVLVTAEAGESWDSLVAVTVDEKLSGFECLSGIPGSTGATPVQNVGAYGEEISQTFHSAEVFDRVSRRVIGFDGAACRFVYRSSIFKRNPRYVILSVTYRLARAESSVPITYAELAERLGIETGTTAPLARVRDAVLDIRRSKAMVLDPDDCDTNSVGSFFTNPLVACSQLPPGAPHWPAGGNVKVSAAWLIGRAGYERGHRHGRARLSTKHTLAITNPGGASAGEIVGLAVEIRDAVRDRFGIELQAEPVLAGFATSEL